MGNIKKICICGGGGLGHTCAAVLSSQPDVEVMMYTQHPDNWQQEFLVIDPQNKQYNAHLTAISNQPQVVIPNADMVLLCLPAFLVEQTLIDIKPFLSPNTIVGSVVGNTGFFLFAHEILRDTNNSLFAFQRVPYISRVLEYGKKAALLGYKDSLLMATENIHDTHNFCQTISTLFLTPTEIVDSFYEVTLSNSNPILHTGRLYTMWKDWDGKPFTTNPLFYHDWTDEASQIILQMDQEFFHLLQVLHISTKHLNTLLQHYEVPDASTLTIKLKNIPSFAGIHSPMKQTAEGWIPDFRSRYFTEDFPFGLRFIHDLAHEYNVLCPTIDKVYQWGLKMISKQL